MILFLRTSPEDMDEAEGQSDLECSPCADRTPYKHLGHAQKAFSVLNTMRK